MEGTYNDNVRRWRVLVSAFCKTSAGEQAFAGACMLEACKAWHLAQSRSTRLPEIILE